MLSLLKLGFHAIGLVYNGTYDMINGTFYPNHTDYITYVEKNNKIYDFSNYNIYHNNLKYIEEMNSKNLSYELEINDFIDISFNNGMTILPRKECHNCFTSTDNIVSESVDWRERNAVTEVKNQGECGSCWSFSSTGSIEGINAINFRRLHNASEQQLMDCSTEEGNKGCEGGLMDNAFKYVINHNGLCSEEDYPYQAEQGQCQENQCNNVVNISDYSDVEQNNEHILMRAVSQQPISVAIQANLSSFRFYKSGVYQDPQCGDQLDHGVLIVGYGTDRLQGLDYWIVKNSWGHEWGDNGYIKILRNYDQSESGMCGIASQPSFPIV
mgnify:FL=1